MTPTYSATGRRRQILVPAPIPAESVQQGPAPAQDPPIYRALIRTWADRGRTLPGRHDPEWVRLVAPSALYGYGQFSAGPAPRGEGPFSPGGDPRDEAQFGASRDARDEAQFGASRDPRGEGQFGPRREPRGAGQLSASLDPRGGGR